MCFLHDILVSYCPYISTYLLSPTTLHPLLMYPSPIYTPITSPSSIPLYYPLPHISLTVEKVVSCIPLTHGEDRMDTPIVCFLMIYLLTGSTPLRYLDIKYLPNETTYRELVWLAISVS